MDIQVFIASSLKLLAPGLRLVYAAVPRPFKELILKALIVRRTMIILCGYFVRGMIIQI